MNESMFFTISSIFYSILLTVVYFSKKKINSIENQIYSAIIIINILGLVLEVSTLFFTRNSIVIKLLLLLMFLWTLIFTFYVYIISNDRIKDMHDVRFKKYLFLTLTLFAIISLFTIFLPMEIENKIGSQHAFGESVNLIFVASGICIFICLFLLIKNIKSVIDKKYFPLYAFLGIGALVLIVQFMNPKLLLITPMETFVTFLMYFTIENPDLKMINELNIAKSQAEKANHAKSDFLSNMSHEIRTPLNAIVGFSQALTEEDLPPQAKEEVKDIMMASETLLDIVNGILDISKIEANKLEIVNTEYNFQNILEELVSLTKARLGEKPLDFRCNFDPSIPSYLYGDKVRVKQIVLNLLTNAVKYTKEGWIEFKVSSIQKEGVCRLIIAVEDSGIGIKQESIDKLFTKFERLDIEKNNTIEGTGLGLAITKKLLELMGGQIVVQSVYGQGSKFTVAIDQRIVENPTIVTETIKTPNQNIDLSDKKVLVVDDNKINLKVASRLLSDYHIQIETVDNGFDALEKIKMGVFYDLILMDDMMPKMSGVETLKQLMALPDFNIPTVALTANAISGMREKYLQEGFQDYLAKPIDKTELYRVLVKFLQQEDIL